MPTSPRSYLFVPAINTRALQKAFSPDVVDKTNIIIDLEDAVNDIGDSERARELKAEARAVTQRFLQEAGELLPSFAVRINSPKTEHYSNDVQWLAGLEKDLRQPLSVMLPKVDNANEIQRLLKDYPRLRSVLALIETQAGNDDLPNIMREPAVEAVAFGHHDFFYEKGEYPIPASALTSERYREILRNFHEVLQAGTRDVEFIDGIYPHLKDGAGLQDDIRYLHQLFRERPIGKLTLNPYQAAAVDGVVELEREVHLSDEDEHMDEASLERLAHYTMEAYQKRSDVLAVTKAANDRYVSPQEFQLAQKYLTDREYNTEFRSGPKS